MTTDTHAIIGADPGANVGFAILYVAQGILIGREFEQRAHDEAPEYLRAALSRNPDARCRLAIERYVVRRRASRVKGGNESTRRVTFELILLARDHGAQVATRSAAQVKAWATNDRLAAAELFKGTVGLRHARDATRHALFEAVAIGLLDDPAKALL